MTKIIMISAVSENGVIGKNGKIPWYISEDFQRFKEMTLNYPIIMGKNTWQSLPIKPLKDRLNIVLSRGEFSAEGVVTMSSLREALDYCKNYEKIFLIGGSQIYNLGMLFADELEITKIHKYYDGDVYFPEINLNNWELIKQEDKDGFSFLSYRRIGKKEFWNLDNLKQEDKEVFTAVYSELERQKNELNMIPSENYCSPAVLEACGSVLNNKYAEGYPKKRYYQGNRFIDDVEILAIERAKKLFGAEHVNVQAHSGSGANMAVYFALLNPGDKIMAMNLSHGGHLTHGSQVNFSGKTYQFIHYGVEENGFIDMNKVNEIAQREKPKLILCGYTAYPRKIDFRKFAEIAQSVGAISMADISHIAGLCAGGAHENPTPYFDIVTTTTHKTLRGPRSAMIMCKQKFAEAIDKAVFPGLQGGPHEHIIAGKAVCFLEDLKPEFKIYSEQIVKNAKVLAETLKENGIKLVSDGTDNHLILVDLIKTPSVGKIGMGKEAAIALEEAGIVLNANSIPFDPSTPFKPSGLRLGTPILTTRGMKESEMKLIGKWMADIINNLSDISLRVRIKNQVKELCDRFKFY